MSTSRVAASLTIFACTISGGLLTPPSVFARVALAPALLLVLLSAATTVCSLVGLVQCAALDDSVRGYSSLLASGSGSAAARGMNGVIAVFLTGVIGSSFIVVREFLVAGLGTSPALGDGLTLAVAGAVGGMSLPREMGRLQHAAAFSTAAFCFLVATLVYYGSVEIRSGVFANATLAPAWWHPPAAASSDDKAAYAAALGSALPVLLYSFGCQFQVFDIFASVMQGRPQGGGVAFFVPSVLGAVLAMTLLFSIVGIFGVFAFPGQAISGNILQILPHKGTLGAIAQAVLVVALCAAAPLIVHPARACLMGAVMPRFLSASSSPSAVVATETDQIEGIEKEEEEEEEDKVVGEGMSTRSRPPSFRQRVLLTTAIVAVAAGLAVSRIDFLVIVEAMGSFLCSPLFFIAPGVSLMRTALAKTGQRSRAEPGGAGAATAGQWLMIDQQERAPTDALQSLAVAYSIAAWLIIVGVGSFALSVWSFCRQHAT
jgi:amino acid permease